MTERAVPPPGASATRDPPGPVDQGRLANFPVAFFAVGLGLGGLTLATRMVEAGLSLGGAISGAMLAFSLAAYGAIALMYLVKVALRFDAVVAEWRNPVRIAFFPTASTSLLLIAAALAPDRPDIAWWLWVAGVAGQAVLTLAVVSAWIGRAAFQTIHLSPAWFLPVVGNVVVPISGAAFGHEAVGWLFFTAGFVFWLVLLVLVFNRLVFHDPLPERLAPTLAILVAPPALAFTGYLRLGGEVDAFARILLDTGYVFLAIVALQLPRLVRLPFTLSFWALSFPLAALAIASLLFAERSGSLAHAAVGLVLWGLLALLVAVLTLRTLLAVTRREIARPE